MTQHRYEENRYEVRGYYFEEGNDMMMDFVYITPFCPTPYAAKMFALGKLKDYQVSIERVTRIIE